LEGYKLGVPFYIEVEIYDFDAKSLGESERDLAKQSSEKSHVLIANEGTRDLLQSGKLPHKPMGTALFEVGQMLGSRGNMASKALQSGGVLYAHVKSCRAGGALGVMNLQLQGLNLKSLRIMGRRSNPFFELCRKVDSPRGVVW
jgi:hypothetical protein